MSRVEHGMLPVPKGLTIGQVRVVLGITCKERCDPRQAYGLCACDRMVHSLLTREGEVLRHNGGAA